MSADDDRAIAAAIEAQFKKGQELEPTPQRLWGPCPEMMRAAIHAYEEAKASSAGATPAQPLDGSDRAIREGYPSKVHWIREYRVRTGSGLKVALDAYESGKPMAAAAAPERIVPSGAGVMASPLPEDLFSHHRAWRSALVAQRDSAKVEPPDVDDRAYWQHELDVFDRVFAELSSHAGSKEGAHVDAG